MTLPAMSSAHASPPDDRFVTITSKRPNADIIRQRCRLVHTIRSIGQNNCHKKGPEAPESFGAFYMRSLAVTYSGMACGHTTIGAERFHFRVRNGIGWFPLAMAARQNRKFFASTLVAFAHAPPPDRRRARISSNASTSTGKRLEVIWSSRTGN